MKVALSAVFDCAKFVSCCILTVLLGKSRKCFFHHSHSIQLCAVSLKHHTHCMELRREKFQTNFQLSCVGVGKSTVQEILMRRLAYLHLKNDILGQQ